MSPSLLSHGNPGRWVNSTNPRVKFLKAAPITQLVAAVWDCAGGNFHLWMSCNTSSGTFSKPNSVSQAIRLADSPVWGRPCCSAWFSRRSWIAGPCCWIQCGPLDRPTLPIQHRDSDTFREAPFLRVWAACNTKEAPRADSSDKLPHGPRCLMWSI